MTRRPYRIRELLTRVLLPRHPIAAMLVRVSVRNAAAPLNATIQRIDEHHANAKRLWQELGEPQYPDTNTLAQPHAASALRHDVQALRHADGILECDVALPALAVAAVSLHSTTRLSD